MSTSTAHGMALSSWKNFKTYVNKYVEFCTFFGLDMFPADTLQERRFVQYLGDFHESIDSSKSYVGGMRALHEIFGFEPPPSDDYSQYVEFAGTKDMS